MILFVANDEEFLQRFKTTMGKSYAYITLYAESGAHALHLLSIIAEEIDLVLVDVDLEKTEASSFLSALKEHHPTIPVIAMSDFPETATLFGTTEVLRQPISAAWKDTIEKFRSHRREQE